MGSCPERGGGALRVTFAAVIDRPPRRRRSPRDGAGAVPCLSAGNKKQFTHILRR